MTESIDLSVVTVSRDVRDLLTECLRSLEAGRDETLIEVLVVDAGSSDGSHEIYVHVAREPNRGDPRVIGLWRP